MTTAYDRTGASPYNNQDANVYSWTLAAGETGDAVIAPAFADRSVQVFGTFGATLVWEGTNEPNLGDPLTGGGSAPAPTHFETLTDPLGNPMSFTARAAKAVTEMMRLVRPRVVGGDINTAITIIFMAKR